ncbi:hypothetical protein D3C76_1748880 [compost metagenome]
MVQTVGHIEDPIPIGQSRRMVKPGLLPFTVAIAAAQVIGVAIGLPRYPGIGHHPLRPNMADDLVAAVGDI